jgi:hypothetical protein
MGKQAAALLDTASAEPSAGSLRTAGVAILLSAIVSIGFVAIDPPASGNNVHSILQSLVEIAPLHQWVHGVAMACITGLMFGYAVLSRRLGLQRTPVLLGLIAYAMGSMLMLIGTVIDGFVSTDTAALFLSGTEQAQQFAYWLIRALESVLLTDIARVAWVLQSVAAIAWSIALLRNRGLDRAVGIVGLAAGGMPAVAVFYAGSAMSTTTVVAILLVQGIWNVAAALWLLRKQPRVEPAVQGGGLLAGRAGGERRELAS